MLLELQDGQRIDNIKHFFAMADYALAKQRYFVFFEGENGELLRAEIPSEKMNSFNLADDGEEPMILPGCLGE